MAVNRKPSCSRLTSLGESEVLPSALPVPVPKAVALRLPKRQGNSKQMLGTVHFVLAIAALIFGAAVISRPKGDQRHKVLGYFYAVSLLLVNVSALSVYEASTGIGPFHILALVSLVTLISGFFPAFLRRPVTWWLDLHAYFMSWSYVGLVAAGAAQFATMSTSLPPQLAVGLPSILLVIIGGVLIHTRIPQTLVALSSGKRQPDRRLQPNRSACG